MWSLFLYISGAPDRTKKFPEMGSYIVGVLFGTAALAVEVKERPAVPTKATPLKR